MRWTLLIALLALGAGCPNKTAPTPPQGDQAHCATSGVCREYGLCTGAPGACVAASDADCRQARICKRHHYCTEAVGRCVRTVHPIHGCGALSETEFDPCKDAGQCDRGDGTCREDIRTNADCTRSSAPDQPSKCESTGLCTARDGYCVATSDAQCAKASICRQTGHCVARGGLCRAVDAAACRESEECRTEGRCTYDEGICRVSKADCDKLCTAADGSRRKDCRYENGQCHQTQFIYFQF